MLDGGAGGGGVCRGVVGEGRVCGDGGRGGGGWGGEFWDVLEGVGWGGGVIWGGGVWMGLWVGWLEGMGVGDCMKIPITSVFLYCA